MHTTYAVAVVGSSLDDVKPTQAEDWGKTGGRLGEG